MYDNYTGRFMEQDPTGFDAGDINLYRYVKNEPTRYTDPSGLVPDGILTPEERAALRRTPPVSENPRRVQIGLEFPSQLEFDPSLTAAQQAILLKSFRESTLRMVNALEMLENWTDTTRRFRYTPPPAGAPEGALPIESGTWRALNRDRTWMMRSLREALAKLRDPNTIIPIRNRPNEVHPQGNCAYTSYWWGRKINLRGAFWQPNNQGSQATFWMAHELARFLLDMADDQEMNILRRMDTGGNMPMLRPMNTGGHYWYPGVQSWDQYLSWLFSRAFPS